MRAFLHQHPVLAYFVLVFALLLAVLRSLRGPAFTPLRLLATAYVDLFRGIPTILVILLLGFGMPALRLQGVPKGEIKGPFVIQSQAYPGTQHTYWVYVPAQYDAAKPTALMVYQDGQAFKQENGDMRAQHVMAGGEARALRRGRKAQVGRQHVHHAGLRHRLGRRDGPTPCGGGRRFPGGRRWAHRGGCAGRTGGRRRPRKAAFRGRRPG